MAEEFEVGESVIVTLKNGDVIAGIVGEFYGALTVKTERGTRCIYTIFEDIGTVSKVGVAHLTSSPE